jgi:hypothetical protein
VLGASPRVTKAGNHKGACMKARLCAVFGVVCSALVIASVAWAAAATTKVTIKGPDHVYGKILSSRHRCLGGRTVKVFKQKGSTQRPRIDKKMDVTTSDRQGNHGVWDMGNPGFPHGKYYAHVTRKPGCKAASSKTVKF